MINKVKCIPKREYTFDEVGEFIFQSNWNDCNGVGINITLTEKMMREFDAVWDSETDKYNIQVVKGVINLNFAGKELKTMYYIKPVFG